VSLFLRAELGHVELAGGVRSTSSGEIDVAKREGGSATECSLVIRTQSLRRPGWKVVVTEGAVRCVAELDGRRVGLEDGCDLESVRTSCECRGTHGGDSSFRHVVPGSEAAQRNDQETTRSALRRGGPCESQPLKTEQSGQ
jgi:hypothetical protein